MSDVKSVNDSNFDTVVTNSTVPVLVEFGAEWCGPCKRMAPILSQLAARDESIKVLKLDIDESPTTTAKFGVRSVPTMILFKDGKPVATKVGLVGLSTLDSFITEKLSG